MQNFYERLGLDSKASDTQIKNAYRKLALRMHPDKGGSVDQMRMLNEAYQTLSDPSKRRDFDEKYNSYSIFNEEDPSANSSHELLTAGNIKPFSYQFRLEHSMMIEKYSENPLAINSKEFSLPEISTEILDISHLEPLLKLNLTLKNTITILMACLALASGDIKNLDSVKNYLATQLTDSFMSNQPLNKRKFYEGFREIIFMLAEESCDGADLMFAMMKITDYAKQASDNDLLDLIPLFYNRYFRKLFAYALDLYFLSVQAKLFQGQERQLFDGFQEAKDFFNLHKERFSDSNDTVKNMIRLLGLLYRFEKDIRQLLNGAKQATHYREIAFHGLDWLGAIREKSNKAILANLFIQIATLFQQAATMEAECPAKVMADEQMALKLYMTAVALGVNASPDLEIYINTQVIKYLMAFKYLGDNQIEILQALKKQTLNTVDIYPFFELPKSNIAMLRQEGRTLHLMRRLLNTMVNAYEHNKKHSNQINYDHLASTVLYQAYEACLKNWYTEEYQPELEYQLRIDLMEELLLDNVWTSFDVEQILDSPDILVDRDEQGWLKPGSLLPFGEDARLVKYQSVNGFEVNHKTGEIKVYVTAWDNKRPQYEKTFSHFDLQDMLERKIFGGFFSLDPVDPEKPYHPFNQIRFAPDELYESVLFNSMLLTDYILKFLTTNQEVQGRYPFDQRSVANMISHLPQYLKDIIQKFQLEERPGALHRFWIEAEEVDVTEFDTIAIEKISKFRLDNIRMVVKKHRMQRNVHGELIDVSHEDEGWQIYVFENDTELAELLTGHRQISTRAMIFIMRKEEVYFWENHELVKTYKTENYRESLIRIFRLEKDGLRKINMNSKNMPLIFRVTNELTEQVQLPHHYSPEFVFAHEFTTHYDEFSQYIPEFGRLKELSKISVLVKFLAGIQQNNLDTMQAVDFILNPQISMEPPKSSAYIFLCQRELDSKQKIIDIFKNRHPEFNLEILRKNHKTQLNNLYQQIQPLDFNINSPEVTKAYNEMVEGTIRFNNYRFSRYQVEKQLSGQRYEIARNFTEQKRSSVFSQLTDAFKSSDISRKFMAGNIEPAIEKAVIDNLLKQFTGITEAEITTAISGNQQVIENIAKKQFHHYLTEELTSFKKIDKSFKDMNFGVHKPNVDVEQTCLWVPASVRHEVIRNQETGLSRYSFFVYGGVNIQPRTNINSGGGTISGNSVGSASFNRRQVTRGFQDHHMISESNKLTKNHQLLELSGLDINARANKIYLPAKAEFHKYRTIHIGRHNNAYSENIATRMNAIVDVGKANNWSQAQYRDATRQMLSVVRQELRAGTLSLNKHVRQQPGS